MAVVRHQSDPVRTEELGLSELLVIEGIGDDDHCFCVPKRTFPQCPKCGSDKIRNQGNMQRDYLDIIPRDDDAAVITISLEFRKNKCLSPGCGCVFYPSFTFASRYSRTTHRLENAVVRMILQDGYSYSDVSEMLEWKLSKQVVGLVYYRRLRELEANPESQPRWFRRLQGDDPKHFWRIIKRRAKPRL